MLSKEQIDKINKLDDLAAKAVQGAWRVGETTPHAVYCDGYEICGSSALRRDLKYSIANSAYIAAANPQAVSELIAMLRDAQKELSFQIAEHQREYDLRIEAQKDAALLRESANRYVAVLRSQGAPRTIARSREYERILDITWGDFMHVLHANEQRDCDGAQHANA